MTVGPFRVRRVAAAALALLSLPGALHGCSGPTEPPTPPTGGTRLTLDFDLFVSEVAPVIERHGCDATGDCHGGGIRGSLELSPPGAKDARFDFERVALQVWATERERSPILTEPLALDAGGTPHAVKPFDSTADSSYRAIRGWIEAGVTQ